MVGAHRTIVYLNIYNQIYSEESLRDIEEIKVKQNKLKSEEYIQFKMVTQGFHSEAITKIDTCL
jgi:hypothetical protein